MSADDPLPASVITPFYRHTPYLVPAIESILSLEYDRLQIVMIDDASPDDAYDVVKRLVDAYSGPHEIVLRRNDTNLSMAIYNELVAHATAEHLIVAHDDDIQYSHRVKRVMEVYAEHDVSMVTCNAVNIDAHGKQHDRMVAGRGDVRLTLAQVARSGRPKEVQGAALSWRRDVLESFGPVSTDRTARTSDFIFPFRAALLKGVYFLDEPLLDRREHPDSRGKIGNQPGDEDVTKVELASERITQMSYLLETLDAFAATTSDRREEIEEARENLILKLTELARELGTHRNRLHMRKLQMSWISHRGVPKLGSELDDLRVKLLENHLAQKKLAAEKRAVERRLRVHIEKANALAGRLGEVKSDLERQRRKTRALRAAVGDMKSSTSWKVTAPLRSAVAAVRRVFGRKG